MRILFVTTAHNSLSGMGGLFGSEYWTYTLPRRVGARTSLELTEGRLTISARYARDLGFLDDCFGNDIVEFEAETVRRAEELARHPGFRHLLESKRERRIADERRKPLAAYRVEELSQMSRSFFGPSPAYHEARHRFVHKGAPAAVLQGLGRRLPISDPVGGEDGLRHCDSEPPL